MRRALLALAVVLPLSGCGLGAAGAVAAPAAPPYNVALTACGPSSTLLPTLWAAPMTVTNNTGRAHSYLITISANDAAGNRVGELNAAANSIAPGQTALVQAMGTVNGAAARCEPVKVTVL